MRGIRELLKGVDGVRAQRVLDVFHALEGELGTVNGDLGAHVRRVTAAQLTGAFFAAELREEVQEVHKAIYDGNPS